MAKPAMTKNDDPMLNTLRGTITSLVASDKADLSARQLAVLLTVYTAADLQTVRGLAKHLNVSKPAITRALDRLGEFEYIVRKEDPMDRRSINVERTSKGLTFVKQINGWINTSAANAGLVKAPKAPMSVEPLKAAA